MIFITVEQLITDYSKYKDKYVFVEGDYDGILLRGAKGRGLVVDKDYHFHSSLDSLLKKLKKETYKGKMRVVGKVGVAMTPAFNIGQILKVDLLGSEGEVIEMVKINETSIPKELRGEI